MDEIKEEKKEEKNKLTREEATKLIQQMVEKTVGDSIAPLTHQIQEQLDALKSPESQKVHGQADDAILAGRAAITEVGNRVFYKTPEGSILNLKNRQRPWVALSEEVEGFAKGLSEYIRGGCRTVPEVLKTMVEGTGASGGFLVPAEFIATVVMYDSPEAVLWPRATIWPMGTDKVGMPRLAQVAYDSDADNIDHFAGVSFTWVEENTQKPETEPGFELLELIAHELVGYTELSNALIDDSPVNLMNFLTTLYGRAWMFQTDRSFFRGTGGRQPIGIINDPRITAVNRTTAGTVVFQDLLNMDNALPSVFDANAVWFCGKPILNGLRGQTDTAGQLILKEYWSDVAGGLVANLLGYPVVKSDDRTPAIGVKGDIILCAPEHYYIGDRRRYSIDTSIHARFRYNLTAVRLTGRLDGQPAQSKAFVVLDDVAPGS